MTAIAVGRFTRDCEECGHPYQAIRATSVRWCPDCRQEAQRKARTESSKRCWRSLPLEDRQRRQKIQNARPESKRRRAEYYHVVCTRCGSIRHRDIKLADRPSYLCRACKVTQRLVTMPCAFCGLPVTRNLSTARQRAFCVSCLGRPLQVGNRLGLSRQRIYQLSLREIELGFAQNKREALDILLAGNRHTAATRPPKPKHVCPGCGEKKHLRWQGFCAMHCAAAFAGRHIMAPSPASGEGKA